ncbi:MAG: molybdopterin-guanine dinucleotide biosynthesis protein MobB [Pseudomonadota bacterium]|jgi:molybdopterin-guanine dinucleotide biosynthesis protein B
MITNAQVPIIGFVAASGSGKTTLLTELLPILTARGWRVGVIKHSHHAFEIDYPRKDSFRLRTAGASPVMIVSPHRRAIISELNQLHIELSEQLAYFPQHEVDLILVEGFKSASIPKIEIYRQEFNSHFEYLTDSEIIALATDAPLSLQCSITQLPLNQPSQIADYLLNFFNLMK